MSLENDITTATALVRLGKMKLNSTAFPSFVRAGYHFVSKSEQG